MLVALRRSHDVERVTMEDFDAALAESGASVTPEMESEYEHIRSSLGHEGPLRRPIGFRPAAAAE